MQSLRHILEGLLKGMDDTLNSGDADLRSAMNLDTLPKVKDFKKYPYTSMDWTTAAWYCPNVLAKYRSKYPDMVEKNFTAIHIIIDKYSNRLVHVDLWFAESTDNVCRKKAVQGWTDGFTATVAKCKGIAIDMITFLANNPEKMDEVMEYAYECFKFYANNKKDDGAYKVQRSIIDLKNKG